MQVGIRIGLDEFDERLPATLMPGWTDPDVVLILLAGKTCSDGEKMFSLCL